MGLIQEIPNPEDFITHLSEILGSEADKTGLTGVLKNMNELDISNLTSSTIKSLTDAISSEISIDPGEFTGGILDQFDQAKQLIPEDPGTLVGPLKDTLSELQDLTSLGLSNKLLESIGAFNNIQTLVPNDTRELLSGASDGLVKLKDQFISGSWGEIAQWSSSVKILYDEISPLFESGSSKEILEKVIEYFGDKITDLIKLILPQQKSFYEQLSDQLDSALSSEIVNNIRNSKSDLIDAFNQARQEFENGNFANNVLDEAESKLTLLTDKIADVIVKMKQALNLKFAIASGMQDALKQQLTEFKEIEIVNLGNIKDKFSESIQSAEDTLRNLKLNLVKDTVENVFQKIDEVIEKFDIGKFTEYFNDLLSKIEKILNGLQATLYEVVASIRNIFNQIKESFSNVISVLGSYDEDGEFHFFIEENITDFLNKIKSTLDTDVKKYLDDFKNLVDEALQKVNDILIPLQEKIETVKGSLEEALSKVSDYLTEIDIEGKLEETQNKINNMLSELGEIDFDFVVDPVIDQINEMRDDLNEIDTSSLNDYLKGLLKVAVEVVKKIDFPEEVTNFLLKQIDKILAIPKDGLQEIENYVETGLEKITQLEPNIILQPLSELYNPIEEQLDVIQVDKLFEPLDGWHADLQNELDKLSPAALMQPVVELYEQLQSAFGSVSPEALIQPIQELIDNFKSEAQRLDISSIAKELDSALQSVKDTMDGLSPEKFFTPLVNAYDKIVTALDRFNPGNLLEPFSDIFNKILEPLDLLSDAHVNLIGEAVASIRSLPDAFDPEYNFQKITEKYTELDTLLEQINTGSIIADLKGSYDALKAAFEPGGTPGNELADKLEALNPLTNATIAQAATEFQQFQSQLQTAFSQSGPTDELVNEFRLAKPDLEQLVPTWLNDNMTVESVKTALIKANPLNISEEIKELYDVFKEQFQNFNPRIIQENVKESFEKINETFSALDPQALLQGVQNLLDKLNQQLDEFDLQFMVQDLTDLVEQVETVIMGMDPRQIIQQLEQLTNEVKELFEQLKPSLLLSGLNEPVQIAKDIIGAFAPMEFQEPLQKIFTEIQKIIAKIDIGIILKPLNDRLEELRNELNTSLKRTETAFDGMIAAIPV